MSIKCDSFPDDPELDPTNEFAAKWYLNGFPKSGLHFGQQFIKPLARLMPPGQLHPLPWVGSFQHHSWSEEWQLIEPQLYKLSRLLPGHYFKGHCAWREDIEHFMWFAGIAHVFIYRDLRDVAVSQAYHVLSDDDNWKHPAKDRYAALGSFDKVLEAVIIGLDEWPGVMHRWEMYAPWLDVEWVFKFQYEDALERPAEMAESLINYGLERIANIFRLELVPNADSMETMTEAMVKSAIDNREQALTFRKGVAGEWRNEFTDEHIEIFKGTDTNNWIARLGYSWER